MMAARRRWDWLGGVVEAVPTLAKAMAKICRVSETWAKTDHRDVNSLWGRLSEHVLRVNHGLDRFWLRIIFVEDRNDVQTEFRRIVGEERVPRPVATSTPKPKLRVCICKKVWNDNDPLMVECRQCRRWFHLICLTPGASRSRQSAFVCPLCPRRVRSKGPTVFVPFVLINPNSDVSKRDSLLNSLSAISAGSQDTIQTFASQGDDNQSCFSTGSYGCEPNTNADDGSFVSLDANSSSSSSQSPCSPVNGEGAQRESRSTSMVDRACPAVLPSMHQATNSFAISSKVHKEIYVKSDTEGSLPPSPRSSRDTSFSSYKRGRSRSSSRESSKCSLVGVKFAGRESDKKGLLSDDDTSDNKNKRKAKSDNSEDDDDDEYEVHDEPKKLRKSFTMEIDNQEWRPFLRPGRYLAKGWTSLFITKFRVAHRFCPLAIETHKVNRDSTVSYFNAVGHCRHKGCLQFRFQAPKPPTEARPMVVHVTSVGNFHHPKDAPCLSDYIRKPERERLAKKLKHRTPTQVANKMWSKGDLKAVEVGNDSTMPSKQRIRQIRYEDRASKDLDAEPMTDLYLMYKAEQSETKKHRFIRQLSIASFRVICFRLSQIKAMGKLRKLQKGNLVGHLDATGGLVNAFPEEIEGSTQIYSYVISIRSPAKGAPLTVLEFILNQHDSQTIRQCLEYFESEAKRILRIPKNESLFSRIEIDFSPALIKAVVGAYHGITVQEYLTRCWNGLFCQVQVDRPNIHVCRRHSSEAIKKSKNKKYSSKKCRLTTVIDSVVMAYLQSGNFGSTYRRATQLLTICGSKYYTDAVELAVQQSKIPTPKSFTAENESKWLGFDVEGLNSGHVWNGTPFGALFLAHYDIMMEEEELAESFDLKENPYYNKAFTGYLLKTILPCTPLVTHCFFGPTQDYLREDTQAVVENTFRGIKIDELGRQGKNKIGRYVRIRKATLKGTAKKFAHEIICAQKPKPQKSRNSKQRKSSSASKSAKRAPRKRKEPNPDPTEKWKSNKSCNVKPTKNPASNLDLPELQFIPWGLRAKDKSPYKFRNTCTVDNTLMALQILFVKFPGAREYFESSSVSLVKAIAEVIRTILNKQFNMAKALWIRNVAKGANLTLSRSKPTDLVGCEERNSLAPIRSLFGGQFYEMLTCPDHGPYMRDINITDYLTANVEDALRKFNQLRRREHCPSDGCSSNISRDVYFDSKDHPPFFFINLRPSKHSERKETVEAIPRRIVMADIGFELLACHLHLPGHYQLLMWEGQQWLTYDGMNIKKEFEAGIDETYDQVTTVWYIREEH